MAATNGTPAAAQSYTQFATHSSLLGGITSGPDGALWFTALNKIGRITTSGVVSLFPMPTLYSGFQGYSYITTGPDGALWFTEWMPSKIGRIPTTATSTNPQISEFKVPEHPSDIATGPDGALWFSMHQKIGRMSVDGTVTNKFLVRSSGPVIGIAIGPDGFLWGGAGPKIFKMTIQGAAGQHSIFNIPGAIFPPMVENGITTGPDGALWYTGVRADDRPGTIGRIATDGKITEFTIPTNASPLRITSGPDGALWFTECCIHHTGSGTTLGDKIGRITPDGTITEFTISANSSPSGITTGPDGALWFIEASGNIGRFKP
jgi:virginiamycin B lyase